MKLINILRNLKKKIKHQRPLVEILIYKNNLLHNLHEFQNKFSGFEFAPVLKSNAYGHGLIETARILQNETVPFLVIDSLFEARALRSAGIKKNLLIIGYVRPEEIIKNRIKNIAFTITSLEQLKELNYLLNLPPTHSLNFKLLSQFKKEGESHRTRFVFKQNLFFGSLPFKFSFRKFAFKGRVGVGSKIKLHLKIDTGMHRQGILIFEIDSAIELIKNNKNLNLEGVCSHLADADAENSEFTEKQIGKWNNVVEKIKKMCSARVAGLLTCDQIKYFHISASAGTKFLDQANCNLVRLGIGLYGFGPEHSGLNLKPVLEMQTIITGIKKLKAGEFVGYNKTFTAEKDMTIVTLPVGYFEGVDRRLSNTGFVKSETVFCKILGRVSMNITNIDLSENSEIKTNDKIIVISSNPNDKNSVSEIAKTCNTIPYEILVKIPQHLKRIIC